MIRKLTAAAALLLAQISLTPATAANLSVKDGAGATQALCAITMSDSSLAECNVLVDTTAAKINPATKEGVAAVATALGSPFQAGGSIGNTAFGAKLQDATGAAFGTVGNPVNVTGISGGGGSVPTGPAGTPNAAVMSIQGISGGTVVPVSASALPLPAGAATQATLASILTNLGSPLQAGASIGNTAFGITGALPAGANAIGTVGVTALPALPTGTNSIGSIANITGTVPLPTGAATQTTLASILTTLGTPAQAGGSIANITGTVSLPTGAATSALQTTGNTSLTAIVTALGTPAQAGGKVDTVINSTSTDIGASVAATTATTLAAANASRRGFALQNQTAGNCFLSGTATATQDYHSLLIASGSYYESKDSHVGTGALSVICASAGGVYGRQW